MRASTRTLLLCSAWWSAGCNASGGLDAGGPDSPTADAPPALDDASATTDAGDGPPDAPTPIDAPGPCTPPPGPYGTGIGETFADFELPTCDGAAYGFYEDGFCATGHAATVVIFSALWCTVCQSESSRLSETITEPYRARGVRVIQVLIDGAVPGTSVTPDACQRWVDSFGLTNDVIMDATREMTSAHYPEGSFPVTLIVDRAGVIRYRDVHGGRGLSGLATALDGVLASP